MNWGPGHQNNKVLPNNFTHDEFISLVKKRISETNIERVKADVSPFVKNINELEIWSTEYFLNLCELIKFE